MWAWHGLNLQIRLLNNETSGLQIKPAFDQNQSPKRKKGSRVQAGSAFWEKFKWAIYCLPGVGYHTTLLFLLSNGWSFSCSRFIPYHHTHARTLQSLVCVAVARHTVFAYCRRIVALRQLASNTHPQLITVSIMPFCIIIEASYLLCQK